MYASRTSNPFRKGRRKLKVLKLTKKQLIIISAAAVCIAALVLALALALFFGKEIPEREVFNYGDFGYIIKDDGRVEIVSYAGTDTEVVVPTAIDGRSVTSIGASAFSGNGMQKIKLGAFVSEIDNGAFASCTLLEEITWSSTLKSIDSYAFYACSSLKSAILPETLVSLGTAAFSDCYALTEATIPVGVTTVEPYLFYNCEKLTTVTAGAHILSVGEYAFAECALLTAIDLSGAKSFGQYSLLGCASLTSLEISSEVESIGERLLMAASSMKNITVGEGNSRYSTSTGALIDLKENCILYMPSGTEISTYTFPEGIKSVADYAFNNCQSLTTVEGSRVDGVCSRTLARDRAFVANRTV